MKRDMDLIRNLLLEIEKKHDGSGKGVDIDIEDRPSAEVIEHLFMLMEAGFIDGVDSSHLGGRDIIVLRMTWHGHEFLDTIRDPEIWRKTKTAVTTAGGWTVGILADVASGLIQSKLQQIGLSI